MNIMLEMWGRNGRGNNMEYMYFLIDYFVCVMKYSKCEMWFDVFLLLGFFKICKM